MGSCETHIPGHARVSLLEAQVNKWSLCCEVVMVRCAAQGSSKSNEVKTHYEYIFIKLTLPTGGRSKVLMNLSAPIVHLN